MLDVREAKGGGPISAGATGANLIHCLVTLLVWLSYSFVTVKVLITVVV